MDSIFKPQEAFTLFKKSQRVFVWDFSTRKCEDVNIEMAQTWTESSLFNPTLILLLLLFFFYSFFYLMSFFKKTVDGLVKYVNKNKALL